ncbi:MAG: recombinase family protein, partial [bacterium]|nr:recombinase family protein [bacterium]
LEQLRTWCRSQGYCVYKEYVDHESGRKGAADRAAFREMFDAAARHEFDLVLVWSLDRLTREGLAHTVAYLRKLQTYGVDFHSYTEPMLSTRDEMVRDILIGVFSALAKVESVKISERTKAGLERARKAGTKLGRKRKVTDKMAKQIAKHRRAGLTTSAIARRVKLPRTTVRDYMNGSAD